MATFQIFKETSVPGTLQANSIYLITSSDSNYVEMYVTDNTGTATRRTPRKEDIQSMIDSSISAMNRVEVVATIAARDALSLTQNTKVWVVDASSDSTVNSGGAEYLWDHANTQFIKTAEFESMDVTVSWNDIQNRPSSSTAAIDAAVSNSHTHSNKTQLDNIGQNGDGDMTYSGDTFVKNGNTTW